jgi:SAM-dependent methyltransferase
MRELSKSTARRLYDYRYATRWFVGDAIDIGAGADPLSSLHAFYPLLRKIVTTDIEDGDAMLMDWVADDSYDLVHSSNCLEHLGDPAIALFNWIRVCRKNGHIVIVVPDEDLYEQGEFPSTFNDDHKWTFTIGKSSSWSVRSISLLKLLDAFADRVRILKVELLDAGYIYNSSRWDQTVGPLAESAIEIVLQKL